MTTTRFLKPEKAAKETAAEQRNEFVHMGLYDADASPESERRRESNPLSFNALPSIERLALDQGVPRTTRFEDLLGSSWPEDESVDDFLEARKRWRLEGRDPDA